MIISNSVVKELLYCDNNTIYTYTLKRNKKRASTHNREDKYIHSILTKSNQFVSQATQQQIETN